MYKAVFKPMFDLFVSLIAFIILIPLFVVILCLLLIVNKGKVFFLQERPGLKEKSFKVIKFKTMNDQKDHNGNLLPNHLRTTKIGLFLRKLSLDELPQLINVIKGDMSLIGPRPLLFKYIPLFSSEQKRRHDMKPGISGWAQVNGRNAISWTQKFEYDIYYIDHVSFMLDLKIIWLTIFKVLKSENINVSEMQTSEPFNGKN